MLAVLVLYSHRQDNGTYRDPAQFAVIFSFCFVVNPNLTSNNELIKVGKKSGNMTAENRRIPGEYSATKLCSYQNYVNHSSLEEQSDTRMLVKEASVVP